jgi:hypothetical protein
LPSQLLMRPAAHLTLSEATWIEIKIVDNRGIVV